MKTKALNQGGGFSYNSMMMTPWNTDSYNIYLGWQITTSAKIKCITSLRSVGLRQISMKKRKRIYLIYLKYIAIILPRQLSDKSDTSVSIIMICEGLNFSRRSLEIVELTLNSWPDILSCQVWRESMTLNESFTVFQTNWITFRYSVGSRFIQNKRGLDNNDPPLRFIIRWIFIAWMAILP